MAECGLILAIDPGTKAGIAEGVPGGVPRLYVENFRRDPTDDAEDIFGRATFFLADRLRAIEPALIAIEAPIPPLQQWGGTTWDTTLILVGLQGIFHGIARCRGVPTVRVPVNSWRKAFLGNGRMTRDRAKAGCVKLCRQLGWDAPNNDAAEAAGIWSWACGKTAVIGLPLLEVRT